MSPLPSGIGLRLARLLLSAALMGSAAAKVVSGYDTRFLLPHWAFLTMIGIEVIAAVMLWTRWSRQACAVVLAIALGGLLLAFLQPKRPCGCHGWLVRNPSAHAAACSILGLLASVSLRKPKLPRR